MATSEQHQPTIAILQLPGASAFSAFRLEKILENIKQRVHRVSCLSARYLHIIETSDALTDSESAILEKLLTYGPTRRAAKFVGDEILVTPRLGTISPWSSKATDIIHICGLRKVVRAERGIVFYVDAGTPLSKQELADIVPLLHDRMTEIWTTNMDDAALLFDHHTPRLLERIAVLESGRDALLEADARSSGSTLLTVQYFQHRL